jgi:cytochrome c
MNSFELNKILGAILGTCLISLALNIGAGAIFSPEKPAKPGYAIAVKTESEGKPAPKAAEVPLATLLAKASLDKGKSTARQCEACHTFEKGGPNRVGPNLWNIVGNARGEDRGGFNFSSAMKTKGGKWTYDELYKFLAGPRDYIPGTLMTFAGIKNDQQRADVIDFLHTLSDNPLPLPKAEAEKKPAPAASASVGKPGEAAKPAEAPKAGATPPAASASTGKPAEAPKAEAAPAAPPAAKPAPAAPAK